MMVIMPRTVSEYLLPVEGFRKSIPILLTLLSGLIPKVLAQMIILHWCPREIYIASPASKGPLFRASFMLKDKQARHRLNEYWGFYVSQQDFVIQFRNIWYEKKFELNSYGNMVRAHAFVRYLKHEFAAAIKRRARMAYEGEKCNTLDLYNLECAVYDNLNYRELYDALERAVDQSNAHFCVRFYHSQTRHMKFESHGDPQIVDQRADIETFMYCGV